MKVRKEGSDERYLHPFTFVTECTTEKYCNTTGIFNHLANWSNSYINFEMQDGVDVEIVITKLFGDPIQKAVVHPKSASKNCIVKNGKAYVTINKTGLFTVDINGQMDDQDTGRLPKTKGYNNIINYRFLKTEKKTLKTLYRFCCLFTTASVKLSVVTDVFRKKKK